MRTFLIILFVFITHYVKAQLKSSTNDVALVKEINVKNYRGRAFRLTAEVKTKAVDGLGLAAFMVLQVGDGFNFLERSRQKSDKIANNEDWKVCTFEGVIEQNAIKLWLYFLTYGNGSFYLDNIDFRIKKIDDSWVEVPLSNNDFEHSSPKSPLKGLSNVEPLLLKQNVKASIVHDQHPMHNQVLEIKSLNAKPDSRILYGRNKKAGNFISVNGIKLYYEIYGEGEPLVLLHGNGGSISSFSKQIPVLSKLFKVIAIDTRGQGKSTDSISNSFSYNQSAEDLRVVLDSLQLKQVNLLGWSDGGNSALIMAIKHPEYVKNLVVMGANLNPSDSAINKKTLSIVRKDLQKLRIQNKPENRTAILLLEMLLGEPNINPDDLKLITAKALIMASEKDVILEKHTRLIAKQIQQAMLYIFKGETHFVPEENPKLFNQVVLDFLSQ